jgi:ATP-dependent protease HslVU (ClpYQ) ATPase subunit
MYVVHMDITYSQRVVGAVQGAIKEHEATELGVADATGIPRTTLRRRLAAPDRSPFTVVELLAIAEYLGVDVRTFIPDEAAA